MKIQGLLSNIKFTSRPPFASSELKLERQLEHSRKINKEALKPWMNNCGKYCKIDAEYSKDTDKVRGVNPKDPIDLDFFEFAESHLKSEYPQVLRNWQDLKKATSKQNEKLAVLLEAIRTLAIKEMGMPCYYPRLHGKEPKEHINIVRFTKAVHKEMKFRAQTNREGHIQPKTRPVIYGTETFHELEWEGYRLVKSRNKDVAEKALSLIYRIMETPQLNKQTKNLISQENNVYKARLKGFQTSIRDIVRFVDLGNVLGGKCRFCP